MSFYLYICNGIRANARSYNENEAQHNEKDKGDVTPEDD